MVQTLRLMGKGALAGIGLTALIAVWDGVSARGYRFALRTGIIGLLAGGAALMIALLMALAAYWLASRNQAAPLRRRLLIGAIFAGAAGMALGLSSAALWLAAGRPWFP